jgi:hypothetical protein
VVEAGGRQGFCEQFLAAEWRVATSALVGITTDISVAVSDVVKILGLEFFCLLVSESSCM